MATSSKSLPHTASQSIECDVYSAKILVVDDISLMRDLIGDCLTGAGYRTVLFASSGEEAIKIAEQEPIDLVILDIKMPGLDGFEVCERLRKNPLLKSLPILVQSADEKPEQRAKVFRSGATDFVSKPINQPELLARVRLHLEKSFLIESLTQYQQNMEQELMLAQDMQRLILPQRKAIASFEEIFDVKIETEYEGTAALAGDLWGIWQQSPSSLGMYLLDVSGHGVSAALNTFRLHAIMDRFRDEKADPGKFMESLNAVLCDALPTGQFATMVCLVLDVDTGQLSYAGAGAPRPVIMKEGGGLSLLHTEGVPLGISIDSKYETKSEQINPGECILCYSDVFIEAKCDDETLLGEAGFLSMVTAAKEASCSQGLVHTLVSAFNERFGPSHPDDMTAIALHRIQR
ncbi:transcriptional regulator [Kordiimonas sediminis]|uniref:Transcriptional regulator n=1 Tax=Kordiimonas sediminis TaxID=1735581 RepID=A0A919E967_9PROT|nr:fused response regulator/phosphatase [Kordiimonas sediminis]GHF26535.1 transcriptional regulator [Kordiimonas sediminis]